MSSSAKQLYDEKVIKRNLTWTQLTESNLQGICKNPAEDKFILGVATCQGLTYYQVDINSKGGFTSQLYASSCKLTVLGCGGDYTQAILCKVDKYPCSNSYYKDFFMYICPASGCGTTTMTLSTFYSAELNKQAGGNGAADVSYYTRYNGGSSSNSSCNAKWCTHDVATWSKNPDYIVRKTGG